MVTKENFGINFNTCKNFLTWYGYERVSDYGLKQHFDRCRKAKENSGLLALFESHPNYNGRGQIVLSSAELKRPIDKENIRVFVRWVYNETDEILYSKRMYIGLHDAGEYRNVMNAYGDMADSIRCYKNAYINGMTTKDLYKERNRMREVFDDFIDRENPTYKELSLRDGWKEIYVKKDDVKDYNVIRAIINNILDYKVYGMELPIINDRYAEFCNELLEDTSFSVRAVEGQKIMKFIRKLCVEYGLDKVKDIKPLLDSNGNQRTTNNGELRWVDDGYNGKIALLGDSVCPSTYPATLVLSINPIDYWTSSFMRDTQSCHTIDKDNRRGTDQTYEGMYSAGTSSYASDGVTFVMYERPTESWFEKHKDESHVDKELNEWIDMEYQTKARRCIFCYGEDKLIQMRIYPDGRDGGDESIESQFRAIVQREIATMANENNLWLLKRGSSNCYEAAVHIGDLGYIDCFKYDDGSVSYLKRDGNLNYKKIGIGVEDIICPCCGGYHSTSNCIACESCYGAYVCDHCGDTIYEDDIIEIDGYHFCCDDCAAEEGYYRDNYTCDYFNSNYYSYIAVEGRYGEVFYYQDSYNAERDGWSYSDVDENWYSEDDVYTLVDGNTFAMCEHQDAVETPDGWYLDLEDAAEDGWVINNDGEWEIAEAE